MLFPTKFLKHLTKNIKCIKIRIQFTNTKQRRKICQSEKYVSQRETWCNCLYKNIVLDVVIPKKHVWKFIEEFGEKFAYKDSHLGKCIKTIDSYNPHPGGWHIKINIDEEQEKIFYKFLKQFCKKRNLSFRDPKK